MERTNYIYGIIVVGVLSLVFMLSGESSKKRVRVIKAEVISLDFEDDFDFRARGGVERVALGEQVQKKIQAFSKHKASLKTKSNAPKKSVSKIKAKKIAKKVKKKKDKKKKEEKKAPEASADEQVANNNISNKRPEAQPDNSEPTIIVAGSPKQEEKENQDIDLWLEQFFNSPTIQTLRKFISAHETGDVIDATFYGVVQVLIEEPSARLNQLAITAMDVTQSVRSFQILVDHQIFENDKSKNLSSQALKRYARASSLLIIKEVLVRNSSLAHTAKASDIFVDILNDLETATTDKPIGELSVSSRSQKQLITLIDLRENLQKRIESTEDRSMKEPLEVALDRLDKLLNSREFVALFEQLQEEELASIN